MTSYLLGVLRERAPIEPLQLIYSQVDEALPRRTAYGVTENDRQSADWVCTDLERKPAHVRFGLREVGAGGEEVLALEADIVPAAGKWAPATVTDGAGEPVGTIVPELGHMRVNLIRLTDPSGVDLAALQLVGREYRLTDGSAAIAANRERRGFRNFPADERRLNVYNALAWPVSALVVSAALAWPLYRGVLGHRPGELDPQYKVSNVLGEFFKGLPR